jgi:predicted GIY-YIG superfamily endonuclease
MSRQVGQKKWIVYILECNDHTLYTGISNNLVQRLMRHRSGIGARYTRARLPVKLVYSRRCRDHGSALKREYAIKRLRRSEKLALIASMEGESL